MAKSATKPQKLKKGDFKQKKTQAKNGKQKNIKGSKRKLVTSSDAPANKRRKVQNEQDVEYEELGAIDTWDWSEVATDSTMLSSDLGGFLCLEEIDDVQVEYEGDETSGKIVKFKRVKKANRPPAKPATPYEPLSVEDCKEYYDIDTFDEVLAVKDKKQQSQWSVTPMETDEKDMELPERLEDRTPNGESTEQERESTEEMDPKKSSEEKVPERAAKRPSADDADQDFDVSAWSFIDLAEPILNAIRYFKFSNPTAIQEKALPLALEGRDIIGAAETGSGKTLAFAVPIVQHIIKNADQSSGLSGLVLTPTRELALQVKEHIENIAIFTKIRVVAIVGGMSIQKQQRLMKTNPNIIVATPGRLWELFSGDDQYIDMLRHIKFLVLDEADRMLEKGRFGELTNILDIVSARRQDTTDWPEESEDNKVRRKEMHRSNYQTFVYTATLGENLRYSIKSKKAAKKYGPGTMEDLLARLELTDKDPAIIDVTPETGVASRVVEAKIDCLKTERDLYVYYFVTRYPGRTIIFVNAIDSIRRLIPIFKLLNIEVLGLHAHMQQKQRLKNLDRFKANDKAVLIASDVAARGLDIPLVEHVIHYQLPRSGEIYVHRSGRTARANHDGVSLLLCVPEEHKLYTKLCQTLKGGKQYPDFPVDVSILKEMKKRVKLATEIDKLEHQEQKVSHEENWMRRMANEVGIEYDEDEHGGGKKSKKNDSKAIIHAKKAELKNLLAQPMLPFGVSKKYLTGSVISDLVNRLIENNKGKNTLLPAHTSTKALDDLKQSNSKTKK